MDCINDCDLDNDLDVAEAGLCSSIAQQPAVHLSTTRFILLSVGFAGLQIVFSLIFSNGSAFLRSLGLHGSVIALVWLGGPVCGAVLQPYFGLCSEHCRSSWGRRRPYIAGGAVAVVISLLGLAYADAVASLVSTATTGPQVMAILATTLLNAAIQPLQGGLRALLVDTSPPHQLAKANAWASRLTSTANVLGYLAGFIDLSGPSSPLGNSQFRVLCLFSAVVLIASVTLTCVAVREDRNTEAGSRAETELTVKEVVSRLYYLCACFRRLPRKARRVCCIQFFSWLAWAPYLYYISLYIGDTYQRQIWNLGTEKVSSRHLVKEATRMGSLGLLLFSITALLTGFILPMILVRKQETHNAYSELGTEEDKEQALQGSQKPDARIQRMWMWSHVLYATCIFSTFIVTSLWGTYALVGLCGISWAVTIWAPFSLISMAIRDDDMEEEEEAEKEDSEDALHVGVDNRRIERRPGIAMALHNTAISAPQIVAVVISSIVFRVCSNSNNVDGQDGGVSWTLRITAFSAVIAAVIAQRGLD